ncbi:alpha/beta hydrolase [Defluviimonas sp. WL0024]|uniref:Alpha/beta hydrolase n=2 Tax=Albidovulum TaxID=205889 RepID=A0ABT3IZC4_9RHOB|nr:MULTISPECIES: alpha/beta hydrolase [Defluviimonas]MCU9849683.1 alpha/beta hydrolase [Defluviimonas sp. WL0024]MCW3780770.1 alpha/beta hydrolase [Defluviimonas salinarum]
MESRTQKSFTASDGILIRYRVAGAGPPVVLLHGFSMSSEMWWQNGVAAALAGRYRLLAPDMRGHGDSDKPRDPARYGRTLVTDVAELILTEAPSGAHIVGFSMGAELSLPLAVDHPEIIRSLYLIGSGWSPPEIVDEYRIHMDWARERAEQDAANDLDALSALVDAVEATVGLPEAQIAALDLPMAGIAGQLDVERPHLERLARARPDFDLEIFPGVDHMGSWKDPRLPGRIGAFLDAQPR